VLNNPELPARPSWNWVHETCHLLASLHAATAGVHNLTAHYGSSDWRWTSQLTPTEWRAKTRAAFAAPDGRDAVEWRNRVFRPPGAPLKAARADFLGRLRDEMWLVPPELVSAHASMAWIAAAINSRAHYGIGHAFVPEYRRFLPAAAATTARFRLRTASHMFTGSTRYAKMGFLWSPEGELYCDEWCSDTYPDRDTWHVVTECTAFNAARQRALARAIALAATYDDHHDLVPALQAIQTSLNSTDTYAAQAFVFLATLGAVLPDGDTGGLGPLPAEWAECLRAPRPTATVPRRAWAESAAIAVTLPAFSEFAVTVAGPLPPRG
jgi:hypothetical protein